MRRRDQRAMVGLRAGDVFDQVRRPAPLAFAMNFLSQPAEQALIVTLCECLVKPAKIGLGLGEKLGRIEIAKRVGRKVADEPGAPVDVLEAAFRIISRLDCPGLLRTSGSRPPVGRQRPGRRRAVPARARSER